MRDMSPAVLKMRLMYHIDTFNTIDRTLLVHTIITPMTDQWLSEDIEKPLSEIPELRERALSRLRHPSRRTPMEVED